MSKAKKETKGLPKGWVECPSCGFKRGFTERVDDIVGFTIICPVCYSESTLRKRKDGYYLEVKK